MFPALGDSPTTTASVIDFATPSLAIEYIAQATSVTHVTPSERFSPFYPMAAVTTGVSLDSTGVVKTRCSISAAEASCLADDATSLLNECASLVYVVIEPPIDDLDSDKCWNSCEVIRIDSGVRCIDQISVIILKIPRAEKV